MSKRDTKLWKIENTYGTVLFNMGLTQMMVQGIDASQEMTEEEIQEFVSKETEKQNASDGFYFMTPEFMGDILRIAKEIAECSLSDEIIPYIKLYMSHTPVPKEIKLYKEDVNECVWEEIIADLDVDEDSDEIKFLVYTEK